MKVHASYCYFLFFFVFKIRLFFREIFLFFDWLAISDYQPIITSTDKIAASSRFATVNAHGWRKMV